MTNQPTTPPPECHAPEVLDNDHPGVQAATADDPEGWRLTLRHLQDTVWKLMTEPSITMDWLPGPPEAPRPRTIPYGLVFRGEYKEFPLMRTSLDRWLDGLVVNDISTLRWWQMFILSEVAKRGFDPLVQPADIMVPDPALWALKIVEDSFSTYSNDNPILAANPAVRRMLGRLQHQGGPTNLLDWTYDLMVALYFACREKDCKNGRVWFKLIPHPPQMDLEKMVSENVRSFSSTTVTESKSHFLFEPDRTDPRTQAQSSVFLWLDTGRIAWQKEDFVLGFVIPKEHKEPLRKYLCWAHNLEHRTLFADLPGTVDWLKNRPPREFNYVLGRRMMD